MKISILTLIGANNIGAFLQAFALKQTLSNMGFEVEFLTMPAKSENKGKLDKIKRYASQKNFRLLIYKIKTGQKYNEVRSMFPTIKYDRAAQYETVIIGSDEVWNVSSKSFVHYPQYFGKDIKAEKIISYAPSCGNTSYEQFASSGMDFKDFDFISVRDENTLKLVESAAGHVADIVLDPTFLLESYDTFIPEINVKKDFILVYSYGMNDTCVRDAKRFSQESKMPLYSVGTYNSWCDKNLIVSPFEFLAYLKKAKYVITSTFHGTALSINLRKNFVVCSTGSHKINSLLEDFNLQSRADIGNGFEERMENQIDYQKVNMILSRRRDTSLKYLSNALESVRGGYLKN